MIRTKQELKQVIAYEKKLYPNSVLDYLTCNQRVYNWRYIRLLRNSEYHYNNRAFVLHKILYVIYSRRKNRLGARLGIQIWENSFQKGLVIHHNGNIVVNREAKIGENCQLHGDNCIGNNGNAAGSPCIGSNIDIGVGAKIIGSILLADGIKVGANAVVVKSCNVAKSTLVGIPAHAAGGEDIS